MQLLQGLHMMQVILEEFGKFINLTVGADMAQRNQYYGIIFDEINKLTVAGKPIKVCSCTLLM